MFLRKKVALYSRWCSNQEWRSIGADTVYFLCLRDFFSPRVLVKTMKTLQNRCLTVADLKPLPIFAKYITISNSCDYLSSLLFPFLNFFILNHLKAYN